MPRKKKTDVVPPSNESPAELLPANAEISIEEQDRIMEEMAAKEAAKTYNNLHIFDTEIVIVRGRDLDKIGSYADFEAQCDAVINSIISISNNAFTKEEVKTVNITNDGKITVFVKDKPLLEIQYKDFDAALIENLVDAIKTKQ